MKRTKKIIFGAIYLMTLINVLVSFDNSFGQCNGMDITTFYNGTCLPSLVRFIETPAAPSGTVYYWDFGDGKGPILGGDTIYHQYSKQGTYGISLTIVYQNGSKCTITKPKGFLSFTAATSLGFYADNTVLCSSPAIVKLHDTTNNIKARDWYVNGVLLPDHSRDITDTINATGYLSVSMVVTNNAGCLEIVDKKNYIYISKPFTLGFCSVLNENSAHDQITASFKLNFDTTGLNITSFNWSFPGGNPSSYSGISPPSVLYTDLSTYNTVSITVKTATGCIASYSKIGLVGKYYKVSQSVLCMRDSVHIKYIAPPFQQSRYEFGGYASNLKFTGNLKSRLDYVLKFKESGIADFYLSIGYLNSTCQDVIFVPGLFNILPPQAQFTSTNNHQCKTPAKVTFHALFGNPSTGTNTYTWHFYDSLMNEMSGSPLTNVKNTDTSFTFSNPGLYSVKLIVSNSSGCADTAFYKKYVRIGTPDINFKLNRDTLCVGDTLIITNLSMMKDDPANPLYYEWFFFNTDSSEIRRVSIVRSPKMIFSFPGIYNLSFRFGNGGTDCSSYIMVKNAFVIKGVSAKIIVSGADGCNPLIKTLTANVAAVYPKNSIPVYAWSVLPSAGVVILNPAAKSTSVFFNNKGCYQVKLTISIPGGCTSSIVYDSLICIGTQAAFSMPGKICRKIPVLMTNESGANADQFKWSVTPTTGVYIDNDTAKNPKITFNSAGCYTILLQTSKSTISNCFDTVSHQVCINAGPLIHSVFSPDSASHCAPRFDRFIISASDAIAFHWDFGDSTTAQTPDSQIVHGYFKNNNTGYTVKVFAADSIGCISDTSILLNYIKIAGPEPAFTISSTPPCKSGIVNFKNTSKNIFNYFFLYGDNTNADSNMINPHFYQFVDYSRDSNTYIPTMFAYDESGCIASASEVVKLYRPPVVDASVNDSIGCNPLTINFINKTKYAESCLWNFGDGSSDTSFAPVHTYASASPAGQPFIVTMTARTSKGCTENITPIHITVYPTPLVSFSYQAPKLICYKDSVKFFGKSDIQLSAYHWKFGDGNRLDDTSNLQNPVYHFKFPGKHIVTFTGYTSFGCAGTSVDSTIVNLDSIGPVQPEIYYVTVTSANKVLIFYKKNTEKKFSSYTLISTPPYTKIFSTSSRNDTVAVDIPPRIDVNSQSYGYSVTTTDYCGVNSAPSRYHFTIYLTLSRAGNKKFTLNWNKYVGWDSVSGYEIYRLNSGNEFKLIATLGSEDSTYTDSALCPVKYSYYIAAIYPGRKFISKSNVASDIPDYVFPDIPVVLRTATVIGNKKIEVRWDSSAQPDLKYYIVERNANNEGWKSDYYNTKNLSFIDDNVDVHRYSYQYRVRVLTDCQIMGPPSNTGTSILLNGLVSNDIRRLSWNSYSKWDKGVKEYHIQLQQKDGNFSDFAINPFTDTTFLDSMSHKDLVPTCYRVYAIENTSLISFQDTSLSNIVCPNLPSRIFIPNSFTPNNDHKNDIFIPEGLSILNNFPSKDFMYQFKIYNRWGELVFATHDLSEGWDGTFKGKNAPMDVYFYMISAQGADRETFEIKGNVTLIR